ncbi:MAG: DUF4398 domain-containing protein [Halobacteriota archaeon]
MLKKNLFLERKALPKGAVFLLAFLILAFFLMSLCVSVSGVVAKEESGLPESEFVEVKSSPFIEHEDVREKIKNGSEVSITIILIFSPEIEESTLFFYSDLKNANGHIDIDGSHGLENGGSFSVDHKEVKNKEVRIGWSGTAPEVKKRENITLLNITQEIKDIYLVKDIKRDVTSEIIEDAITAMDKAKKGIESANWTIANGTEARVDVSEAKTSFEAANLYLKDANDAYWQGRAEDSIDAATNASYYAELAKQKAESAVGAKKHLNYGGLAVVAIIAIVVIVFLNRQRQRKRGIY